MSPHPASATSVPIGSPDANRQETLARSLDEAREIRGISFWSDAWRRLRRRRTALVSVACLESLILLAILTPVMPLQSPIDKDLKFRRFLPPELSKVTMGRRMGLGFKDRSLVAELAVFDDRVAKLRAERDAAVDPATRGKLDNSIREMIEVEHPFTVG